MTKEEIRILFEIAEEEIRNPLPKEEVIRKYYEMGMCDENGVLIPPFDVLAMVTKEQIFNY
ncbi:hypothetical protein ECE50_026845 [Chitinophaga sp. Mgbs1]|uniref:Uncharacterized protein n=1 Tax=Chitinophaga solisilvae TaxID=1233460 RepID=A0A3S1CUD1_9BACT|nr:hypothetical protein [Chitinophaga solisilvae]